MTLAAIGAGFGRTGTASLEAALERRWFAPCCQMLAVFAQPDHRRFSLRAAVDRDALRDPEQILGGAP